MQCSSNTEPSYRFSQTHTPEIILTTVLASETFRLQLHCTAEPYSQNFDVGLIEFKPNVDFKNSNVPKDIPLPIIIFEIPGRYPL